MNIKPSFDLIVLGENQYYFTWVLGAAKQPFGFS